MAVVKRLCVYCGSAGSVDPVYRNAAVELGRCLAASGVELVYGGGRVGMMGLVADSVIESGGIVTGIIPALLHEAELAHQGVNELVIVGTMHERKQRMFEMADGFAVLPGGLGTLDETFEIITWKLLSLHHKPVIILNTAGYWRPLLDLIDHAVDAGFARRSACELYTVVDTVNELMDAFAARHEPVLISEDGLA